MTRKRAMVLRRYGLGGAAVALISALYLGWPRTAALRTFDPQQVARCETAMWRHYYRKEYGALFGALYRLHRDAYGFSPWDSGRLAYDAAKAAAVFQPTRSRVEARRALPYLRSYFGRIERRGSERFDPSETARLELEWWQLRRENTTPAEYGGVIARVQHEIYRAPLEALKPGALLRAEAMDYRDRHRDLPMHSTDWEHIERTLVRSYDLMKAALRP